MDFEATFPLIFLMNLSRREDRRVRCEWLFHQHGLKVERWPAADALWMKSARGYETKGRRAHVLSTLLILREAKRRRAPAVFLFEDDVVLAPHWREHLAEVELPEDWQMFTLGGQHHERQQAVQPGLIKVAAMLDTHAWGIRAAAYDEVMAALQHSAADERGFRPATDVTLARMQEAVATYAPFPNLAWQEESPSDLAAGSYSNYEADGWQRPGQDALPGLLAESLGAQAWPVTRAAAMRQRAWFKEHGRPVVPEVEVSPVEFTGLAFLFLTRGAHYRPAMWESYWRGQQEWKAYAHIAERESRPGGWLEEARIEQWHETKWGHISLVRAQLALLRAALAEPENSHFLFCSESCVPVRPLEDLQHVLRLDPRSRMGWESYEETAVRQPAKAKRTEAQPRLPASQWVFHSQWVLLNREAAELVCRCDLTPIFETAFAPDESYFGTVLNACGYPLKERVVNRDVTWTRWQSGPHPQAFTEITPDLRAEWLESGKFFARKVLADPATGATG